MNTEQQLSLLAARVEHLASQVKSLQARAEKTEKQWLEPFELAAVLGTTTRSLSNWRKEGRIKPDSYRPTGRGFQYHREKTLADLGQGVDR